VRKNKVLISIVQLIFLNLPLFFNTLNKMKPNIMKKKLSLFLLSFVFAATGLVAQTCTIQDLGGPNIAPPASSLACVERGNAYSTSVQVQNFNQVTVSGFTATVNFLRVDSMINLPCGLDYQVNTSQSTNNNVITTGDSACISIDGTTYDFVGQYKIGLYLTVEIATPLGNQTFQGEAVDLINQIEQIAGPTGLDFNYWLRVTEPGASCPNIDTTSSAWNLQASTTCPSPSDYLVKALARPTTVCAGDSVELYAATAGGSVSSFAWTPGATVIDPSLQETKAVPAATTTYSVAISGAGSASDDVTIDILPAPTAAFSSSVSVDEVTFTNTSADATSYSWDFGDGTNSNSPNPVKTYLSTGTFDVTLTATNQCGFDDVTQQVTISSSSFCTLSATCSPQSPTGTLGLSPSSDNMSCADRGVFYQQYLYLEVPATLSLSGITATINYLEVNSVENMPCGIAYRFDKASQLYNGGETGCLEFFGTTIDAPGQYDLGLFVTLDVTIPGLGTQEFSGRADDLIEQLEGFAGPLGIDFNYWIRVKNTGTSCPALDRAPGATNATSSCEGSLQAIGLGSSCDVADGTLTAAGEGGYTPYTVEWEGGRTNPDTLVGPNDVLLVKVTDSLGNVACSELQLMAPTAPVSDFDFTVTNDLIVEFDDNSSDALDYEWDFGDNSTVSDLKNPTHRYSQAFQFLSARHEGCHFRRKVSGLTREAQ
jgi:PKD repeat protein